MALLLVPVVSRAQTPVSYFGAIPDLKVSGNEFVDPTGKAVTLHGVMDTPSTYFNGGRWSADIAWPVYDKSNAPKACRDYFTKVYQAIANPAKGTYCNLFRLHLDPAWATYDASVKASGFREENKKVYDPHGNEVSGEASIYHFDMDKFKARMTDLYVPLIEDALAHGLYVVVRPPGVFPHDVWVGDYYNTFLTNIWDEISKNDYIKSHSGQIMLELGNEPVRVWKTGETIPSVPTANKTLDQTRGDAYNGHSETYPVLHDFFQPIVDKIRNNGFDGIILLPGTSFQANYKSYNKEAITDSKNNYGYAVHNYPGWYGGWNDNQSTESFISTFEAQVLTDKPIVITEVDWSPEWRLSKDSHWNEDHTQFTAGNYGTWGTGTTDGVTQGVDIVASQNVGWGKKFQTLVNKHKNISWTLQGTTTYVDMDTYLMNGTVQPAFIDQMKKDGYPDARQACSGACFDWFKEYACGNRIPYGTPSVAPEVVTYYTTATTIGNAKFDETNAHYCFYTSTYSSFTFKEYAGTPLTKCAEFTINLGEGSTIGYRLDVQLKDANGNIIKDGTNDYIIGTEAKGTRFTTAESKTFDFQTIFAEYLEQYPGCTVGEIRLNTVVSSEDTNREGKYWFTISKMEMNVSELVARQGNKGTSLADVKMYKHTAETKYVYNNPTTLGGWGIATITNNGNGAYTIVNSNPEKAWDAQLNIGNNTYIDGTEYTLQLDIKGTAAGNIGAAIQKSDGYADRGNFPSIPVTTSWQTVTVKATVTGDGADRILLNCGAYSGTLDIKNIKVSYASDNSEIISGSHVKFGEELAEGGEAFSAYFNGNVDWNCYADLSQYKTMVIKGTGGSLRVMYNRPETGTCPEISASLAGGEAVIDLSSYEKFNLNAIKVNWGNTATVNSIMLTGGGTTVDLADYYISGMGYNDPSVAAALADEHATVIDLQGYTGKTDHTFASANPNCILIYKEENKIGNRFDGRNLAKNLGNSYDTWSIGLKDNFDFFSPINIATGGNATYTRDLGTNTWGITVIPFALDVTADGSPEVYVLSEEDGTTLKFAKQTSGTIAAGSVILYYKENGGEAKLTGKNIAVTADGFNIQPTSVNGWYTAQSYRHQVIDDVTTDPYLKDYEVYAISGNKFVHATKKLTLKPFRALYLCKKGSSAAKASFGISIGDNTTGIEEPLNITETAEAQRYDIMGRKVSAPAKGVNIVRMPNGTVRKVLNY